MDLLFRGEVSMEAWPPNPGALAELQRTLSQQRPPPWELYGQEALLPSWATFCSTDRDERCETSSRRGRPLKL